MIRKKIVLGAILSVVILMSSSVLASSIQLDKKSVNNDDILTIGKDNSKELLFQVIEDMTLNENICKILEHTDLELSVDKEIIQKTLLKQQFFINPFLLITLFLNRPRVSNDYLDYMYTVCSTVFHSLSFPEMKTLTNNIEVNPLISEKICLIIQDDDALNEKIEQVSYVSCDCNRYDSGSFFWDFPIICDILAIAFIIGLFILLTIGDDTLILIAGNLGDIFNCDWG